MILVTGGCGFIGSNFVLNWFKYECEPIVVLDKLTYAGNFANLSKIQNQENFHFVNGDINDSELVKSLFIKYNPRAVLNFAAESHVDRSILNPHNFITTNINGTFTLLESARQYWLGLDSTAKHNFRYLQVSTDEVYGSLQPNDPGFTELTPYSPSNPYSASKAAADHIVRSYHHTYGMPVLITNCSNNYGPLQFPEKLIPLTLLNALAEKPLLIYGDGLQIRDWLYVTDHCSAIRTVLLRANTGKTYNIGGHNEKTNLEVVQTICSILDEIKPRQNEQKYQNLITHIQDRPGHDRRYAINAQKIQDDLQWIPSVTFESGIKKTVQWYFDNMQWVDDLFKTKQFKQWLNTNYTNRESV